MLEAVLIRMKNKGRVVAAEQSVNMTLLQLDLGMYPALLLQKGLNWRGSSLWISEKLGSNYMKKLLNEGNITIVEDITEGLPSAPKALVNLLNGKNFGKSMVRVGPDPEKRKMN